MGYSSMYHTWFYSLCYIHLHLMLSTWKFSVGLVLEWISCFILPDMAAESSSCHSSPGAETVAWCKPYALEPRPHALCGLQQGALGPEPFSQGSPGPSCSALLDCWSEVFFIFTTKGKEQWFAASSSPSRVGVAYKISWVQRATKVSAWRAPKSFGWSLESKNSKRDTFKCLSDCLLLCFYPIALLVVSEMSMPFAIVILQVIRGEL